MNPLWLILIIPSYGFMGGFTYSRWHNHKGHNQVRCDEGDDAPVCVFSGIFWPLLLPVLIIVYAVATGIRTERGLRKIEAKEIEK